MLGISCDPLGVRVWGGGGGGIHHWDGMDYRPINAHGPYGHSTLLGGCCYII